MKKYLLLFLLTVFSCCLICSCGEKTPQYEISFMDENGDLLCTKSFKENQTPSYTYEKADTAEWKYELKGWSQTKDGEILASLPVATENASYFAIISKTKQKYTVTFSTDGSAVASKTLEYGSELNVSEKSEKEGYHFVSWCTDSSLKNAASYPMTITGNVTLYASFTEQVDIKALLSTLLDSMKADPWSYIPASMRPDYAPNLLSSASAPDYLTNTSMSSAIQAGCGEQWHMVLENIQQSETFFKVLTSVEAVAGSAVSAFNNYFDQNPSDTAQYEFKQSSYNVTINYENDILTFLIEYNTTLPVIGAVKVQIDMTLDTKTNRKTVRIQLGDANALKYTMEDNKYSFAIKYLGVRKAAFDIQRKANNTIEGHINEYLTVSGKGIHSAADFYITDKTLSVVGNKASGIPGFTGYINELYNLKNGKLLGYEVQETLSKITFNTLWFNISDISGISSLKYTPATDQETAHFYVNGSSTAFAYKTVGGISLKTASRRFDIEFRTQYYYLYNATDSVYECYAIQVPMLFVQEEVASTFTADVASKNTTLNLVIVANENNLSQIKTEYQTLIPIFITNKETVTEDVIVSRIGEAKTFTK